MTDRAERKGEPDLWASPPRPPSRPAKAQSRFEWVAVPLVGWGLTAGLPALLGFVTGAFWSEYPNRWFHAVLVVLWLGYAYHLVTLGLHRRNDHRSDDARGWCPTCYGQYRSHLRG
jgi:hypothetical protein